ncbi:hypothetical protein AB1Y20_014586 [Prymnesium parvum]|uniref:Sfi1 spindle body domain-containing protein n=1 Tax=Prymnesium parvum TaxID=97485 RepID=A0AB34IDI3_PRYPA
MAAASLAEAFAAAGVPMRAARDAGRRPARRRRSCEDSTEDEFVYELMQHEIVSRGATRSAALAHAIHRLGKAEAEGWAARATSFTRERPARPHADQPAPSPPAAWQPSEASLPPSSHVPLLASAARGSPVDGFLDVGTTRRREHFSSVLADMEMDALPFDSVGWRGAPSPSAGHSPSAGLSPSYAHGMTRSHSTPPSGALFASAPWFEPSYLPELTSPWRSELRVGHDFSSAGLRVGLSDGGASRGVGGHHWTEAPSFSSLAAEDFVLPPLDTAAYAASRPRWVSTLPRAEVHTASDRLRALEADRLFREISLRRGVRVWRCHEGRPHLRREQRATSRKAWWHKSTSAALQCWLRVVRDALSIRERRRRVALLMRKRRVLRALASWRQLQRRAWSLRYAGARHYRGGVLLQLAYRGWRATVRERKAAAQEMLSKAAALRRWALRARTRKWARRLEPAHIERMMRELDQLVAAGVQYAPSIDEGAVARRKVGGLGVWPPSGAAKSSTGYRRARYRFSAGAEALRDAWLQTT